MTVILSLVIPCYNESANIPALAQKLRAIFSDRSDVEVLLVDNGSTDASTEAMQQHLPASECPWLRMVRVPVNQGYGYGILQGLEQATGAVLAWTHADLQTDPADALRALQCWQDAGAGDMVMVKGARQNRPFAEQFFTAGMGWLATMLLGVKLHDINAQPKLFSRAFYEQHIRPAAPHDFSLDLYLLYQATVHGVMLLTIPVDFSKRLAGEAKGGGSWKTRIKLIKRTWHYMWELRARCR